LANVEINVNPRIIVKRYVQREPCKGYISHFYSTLQLQTQASVSFRNWIAAGRRDQHPPLIISNQNYELGGTCIAFYFATLSLEGQHCSCTPVLTFLYLLQAARCIAQVDHCQHPFIIRNENYE
jgi:hypothetical protein